MEFPHSIESPGAADRLRVDLAERDTYEALYAAAAATLGTGSCRIGESTLIWHPSEDEAGYNCLVNFHLTSDPEATYRQGVEQLRKVGSIVVGVPIDESAGPWRDKEHLRSLGLSYRSEEVIWGRRIDGPMAHPPLPEGFQLVQPDMPREELSRLINLGWELEPDDPRGVLFGHAVFIPDWKIYVASEGDDIAGVSVFCNYQGVGSLLLAVVMPQFRGRGLQSWFIAERLAEAGDRGCTLAISETNDDNSSPRNLQRAGLRRWIRREMWGLRL